MREAALKIIETLHGQKAQDPGFDVRSHVRLFSPLANLPGEQNRFGPE